MPKTGGSASCLTERSARTAGCPGIRRWAIVAVGSCLLLFSAACEQGAVDRLAPVAVVLDDVDPDIAEGISELFAAARAAPHSGELRGRLAMAYEMNGFPDAALATYAQAAAFDPAEFSWPYFQALLHGRNGDVPAALSSLGRAITIDEEYVPAWLWQGEWSLDVGDEVTAEAAYRRARDLGAGSPAIAGLAQIRLLQGQPGQAVALLESVDEQFSHPQLHRLMGEAYRALGREDDARIAFARGKLGRPMEWLDPRQVRKADYIWGFTNQMAHAGNLLAGGQFDGALALLHEWEDRYPDDPALLTNLGRAYLNQGDLDRAREILSRGVAAHSSTHSAGHSFHYHLGRLYVRLRDEEKAVFHLEKAAELNPTQPHPFEELGKILLRRGETDDALEAFDMALEKGVPNPETVLNATGIAEAARGRWSEAIERFQRATAANPSFTEAYIHLGRGLGQAGRFDEAREALDWAARLGTHPESVASARRALASREASKPDDQAPGDA